MVGAISGQIAKKLFSAAAKGELHTVTKQLLKQYPRKAELIRSALSINISPTGVNETLSGYNAAVQAFKADKELIKAGQYMVFG